MKMSGFHNNFELNYLFKKNKTEYNRNCYIVNIVIFFHFSNIIKNTINLKKQYSMHQLGKMYNVQTIHEVDVKINIFSRILVHS